MVVDFVEKIKESREPDVVLTLKLWWIGPTGTGIGEVAWSSDLSGAGHISEADAERWAQRAATGYGSGIHKTEGV